MDINVVVCDDEKTQVEVLSAFLRAYNTKFNIKINEITDSRELIKKIKNIEIDIAFLDIEMEPYNGIEVGKRIRKIHKNTIIVYITGFKEYALNAFEIRAFDYIIKPITEKNFRRLMKDILLRYDQIKKFECKEHYFIFKIKENVIKLNINDIYCFEKVSRKIRVHTKDETHEFYGTFKQLLEDLDIKNTFIKAHQGYIVNKEKIVEMNVEQLYLKDLDLFVPISRRYKKNIKKVLEDSMFY